MEAVRKRARRHDLENRAPRGEDDVARGALRVLLARRHSNLFVHFCEGDFVDHGACAGEVEVGERLGGLRGSRRKQATVAVVDRARAWCAK